MAPEYSTRHSFRPTIVLIASRSRFPYNSAMHENKPDTGDKTGKRSHHRNLMEELDRLRTKRLEMRFRKHPPLSREPPSILDIRAALEAVRTGYRAMLHLGWLVHWLQRTAENAACDGGQVDLRMDAYGNLLGPGRPPGVRNFLYQSWFDDETEQEIEVDLSASYKTLMRYKRLYERFMAYAGLPADESEELVFEEPVRDEFKQQVMTARALLAHCDGTAASLFQAVELGLHTGRTGRPRPGR